MISGTGDAQGRTRELTDASSIVKHRSRHRSRSTAPINASRDRDWRERCFARSRHRWRSKIAISRSITPIAISQSIDRRFARSRSTRTVLRALSIRSTALIAKRRSTLREIAIDANSASHAVDRAVFFWVLSVFFWVLPLPSYFPNTRKYFPKNFLKCNQTHENIFLSEK